LTEKNNDVQAVIISGNRIDHRWITASNFMQRYLDGK